MAAQPESTLRKLLEHMIMLAGAAEKQVIATFAASDPDALVRATACQYLARVVEPSDRPLYDVLLERAAHDSEEDVRCAASQHLRADAPASVRTRTLERFLEGSLEEQRALTGRLAVWSQTPTAFLAALTGASPEVIVHALGFCGSKPWIPKAAMQRSRRTSQCCRPRHARRQSVGRWNVLVRLLARDDAAPHTPSPPLQPAAPR
ncbi:hypothetical protein [Sorangium sp. So ce388]|uniref:hypothetical protein n=1 Tax=Sorangium sp. So ce388 TaxID=3133309 RepID=UPI003F5B2333